MTITNLKTFKKIRKANEYIVDMKTKRAKIVNAIVELTDLCEQNRTINKVCHDLKMEVTRYTHDIEEYSEYIKKMERELHE